MEPNRYEVMKIAIIENVQYALDWDFSTLAGELYWWVDFFNMTFFKDEPLPLSVISFSKDKITTRGYYRTGHNGLGIKETIVLNRVHFGQHLWKTLATLLHEMTHAWQKSYGTPSTTWYHNKEYRLKLALFGIKCDPSGRHTHLGDPFVFLLKKHGISFADLKKNQNHIGPTPSRRGFSKLKKWSCGCTNVRVAVKNFSARCLKCHNNFTKPS